MKKNKVTELEREWARGAELFLQELGLKIAENSQREQYLIETIRNLNKQIVLLVQQNDSYRTSALRFVEECTSRNKPEVARLIKLPSWLKKELKMRKEEKCERSQKTA